jgi:AraC-like DNA-binding protein
MLHSNIDSVANGGPLNRIGLINQLSAESHDAKYSVVRVDALQHFEEFVEELGGDASWLLERASISRDSLKKPNAVIPYRVLINLLEKAAEKLSYPSFGLQLAVRQGGMRVLGPLEVAMQNSRTIGEAFHYCSQHLQTYSPVAQIQIEPAKAVARRSIRFEILLNRVPHQQQAVEHALGLMHHAIIALSNREVRSREVWFMHEPISSVSTYRRYFGTRVCFGKPINAIFLNSSDFDIPLLNRNEQLYELATSFIDTQYPSTANVLSAQIRVITARLLAAGKCSHVEVADAVGMHPRTLQRRLRDEGISFEDIKDEVRRDVALRYLSQRSMPLIKVATMLGYSEPSVLTRSCYRWFAHSPRRVRELLLATDKQ